MKINKETLSHLLIEWFLSFKRDLPWRKSISPYRVWVSEVMLQQTQVKTVIPYFERWMASFPTLKDLAHAPIEQVIKLWEGLGYYSRARNLHKGANEVLKNFQGDLPSSYNELIKISGIGPYTAGAILSFAFHQKAATIDGNVKRVMSRLFCLDYDFSKSTHHSELEKILLDEICPEKPWIFNEAMMELGALVCTPKNPSCSICPLQKKCLAYQKGKTLQYPIQTRRKKVVKIDRIVIVFQCHDQVLIKKQSSKLMQDLYEFYYYDHRCALKEHLEDQNITKHIDTIEKLSSVKHTFTHHVAKLEPYHIHLKAPIEFSDYEWLDINEIQKHPFSSGHRKILAHLYDLELLAFA